MHIPTEDLTILKNRIQASDSRETGEVSKREFKRQCQKEKYQLPEQELNDIFDSPACPNQIKYVELFDEAIFKQDLIYSERLWALFNRFEPNEKGEISAVLLADTMEQYVKKGHDT